MNIIFNKNIEIPNLINPKNMIETPFNKFVVNTELEIASEIGLNILKKGGNAVDAAIASTIAIGVVNSFSSGIGGGGFLLVKNNNISKMFDFRETSPRNINLEYFKNYPEHAKEGLMSVCVPGEIKGMFLAHNEFGKLPWSELFQESINLCFNGFIANEILIKKLTKFANYIFNDKGLSEIYTRNGKLIKVGDLVFRTNFGETLKTLAKDPMSFYEGAIANQIEQFMKENNGIIDKIDLMNYKVKERPVITGEFMNYKVTTTNLPTSGIFVLKALNILKKFNLEKIMEKPEKEKEFLIYHILIEIGKFIFAKRGEVEDPDFQKEWVSVVEEIISENNANENFKNIDFKMMNEKVTYGLKYNFIEDHGTTHLNVIDKDDISVLLTSTVNLEFGSKVMDPKTGIIFNNQIDDFFIPGIKNSYDLGPTKFNHLEPNKRSFSSASPTIIENENEKILIGASGGTRIPTSIISVILHFFIGKSLKEAISGTRIHNQLIPDVTFVESTFPDDIRIKLESLGHKFQISEMNTYFTAVNGIHVDKKNNIKKIFATSDPRKKGKSCGE